MEGLTSQWKSSSGRIFSLKSNNDFQFAELPQAQHEHSFIFNQFKKQFTGQHERIIHTLSNNRMFFFR